MTRPKDVADAGNERDEPAAYQVEIENVSKRFGEVVAVQNLDLNVRRGEFFSLLGPSGCGKTTTLRMIAGFEAPTQGTIRIGATDMQGLPPYERNIGIVFQSYALFPHMNVFDNVAFGLRTRKVPASDISRRVSDALNMIELDGYDRRKVTQLSGGQQQRVALARALVIEPDVLLLDEPLGALDKKLRESMQIKLMELHQQLGVTTVYVTHDQEEALTMSDRIAVMSAGRIQQIGTPQEIYTAPSSVFVADFIGQTNLFADRMTEHNHGMICTERGLTAVAVGEHAGFTPATALTLSIRPEKIRINTVSPSSNSQNVLEGVVRNTVFVGETTTYHVEVAGDVSLRVKEFNIQEHPPYPRGSHVTLSWAHDDTQAFATPLQ